MIWLADIDVQKGVDVVVATLALISIGVMGLLIWKTQAARVWKEVAEARQAKLDDQDDAINVLRDEMAELRGQVKYLSDNHEKVIIAAIRSLEHAMDSHEEHADHRHKAHITLLSEMSDHLKELRLR